MSENAPEQGDVQDPAEPYQADQEVETADQPTEAGDDADNDADSEEEVPPAANVSNVEVSPAAPPVQTDNVHGKDYEVTPERGYRQV